MYMILLHIKRLIPENNKHSPAELHTNPILKLNLADFAKENYEHLWCKSPFSYIIPIVYFWRYCQEVIVELLFKLIQGKKSERPEWETLRKRERQREGVRGKERERDFRPKGSKFCESSADSKIFIVIIFNPCTPDSILQSPRLIDYTRMHDLVKHKWK